MGKGFDFCIARHPFLLPHVLAIKGKMGIVADNPGNKPLGVPFFEFLEREVGADNRGLLRHQPGSLSGCRWEEVKNGERNSVPRSSRINSIAVQQGPGGVVRNGIPSKVLLFQGGQDIVDGVIHHPIAPFAGPRPPPPGKGGFCPTRCRPGTAGWGIAERNARHIACSIRGSPAYAPAGKGTHFLRAGRNSSGSWKVSKVERDKGLIWLSLLQASIHMRCFRQGQQLPVPEAFILAQGGQAYWGSRAFSIQARPFREAACVRLARAWLCSFRRDSSSLTCLPWSTAFAAWIAVEDNSFFNFLRPGDTGRRKRGGVLRPVRFPAGAVPGAVPWLFS